MTAATGYLPKEEECGFFRLAYRLLEMALLDAPTTHEDISLSPRTLAEQGLVLAESTLPFLDEPETLSAREGALAAAVSLWDRAEYSQPGSSAWARARWAAWTHDEPALKALISHQATEEDNFYWPPFAEAAIEPAFREYRDLPWFKRAWFGYGR
jgi:hypothetical protein